MELIKINHGEPASKQRRSYKIKDQRLRNAASCWSSRPTLEYLLTISGVKSTRKLYSSKSFVTDKKTTRSKVQSTDQKKHLSKSKKVVILKLLK